MIEIELLEAPDVEMLACELINKNHKRLANTNIKYLLLSGKRTGCGDKSTNSLKNCPAKHKYLNDYDFIIIINKILWNLMKPNEQIALINHQLGYCGDNHNGWCCWKHDADDYSGRAPRHVLRQEIVRKNLKPRWGLRGRFLSSISHRKRRWLSVNDDTSKLNLRLIMQKQLLIKMAIRWGLGDPRVIAQSHKVDKLVVEMQRRIAS